MVSLRRDFHKYPESGLKEERTGKEAGKWMEGFTGARLMIEDGALENPCVDAAFALHLRISRTIAKRPVMISTRQRT
jgi:metal-dependent amidase/aminoacylase/carboxypeptidase family protein